MKAHHLTVGLLVALVAPVVHAVPAVIDPDEQILSEFLPE